MNDSRQDKRPAWMVWTPLLLAVLLVTGIGIGLQIRQGGHSLNFSPTGGFTSDNLDHGKLEELLRYVEAKYVDSVDREHLVQDAIDKILYDLDPHSTYLSVERVREESEKLDGNFEGIGIEFMVLDDTIRVVSTVPGGPSERAGVLAGDNIITIGDSLAAGVRMETDEIMRRFRGPKDSEVRIGILRHGEKDLRQLTLTRDMIPMESIDAAYMIEPGIGYIRINRFSATTSQEFNTHMKGLIEQEGLKDLVLDLRQNPGGYLRAATEILSQFFKEKGRLLVYTEGRTSRRQDYETTGRALFDIRNIVVLIDEGSASASEILAGAVQDNDRGLIIGRRSYGKGLVQEQYQLSDGSAVRLTVARYYIPSGRSIQKDYGDRTAYEHDLEERLENGELFFKDSLPGTDTVPFYTLSGRKVYGGGGIYPDVFVPLDSFYQNKAVFQLQAQIPAYVFTRLHLFRERYKGLDLDQFRRRFQDDNQGLLKDLISFAREKGSTVDPAEAGKVKEEILHLVKSRIAKQLYDNESFFVVFNERDADVLKGLEAIKKPGLLTSVE